MTQHIRDIMTTDVTFATPGTSIAQAAQMMRDGDIGALPVGENDRLVGMITDRDIVIRCVAEGGDVNAADVRSAMTDTIRYCRENQTVDEVCRNMGDIQMRRLPVVNDEDRLVGIVSLGDLAARGSADQGGEALRDVAQ
ncbi:CBS domain-containing protein [Aquisalinus flavus]|uniref:Inosine-5-monophosphate dehydrogenase n=1 Tax=Aquisalinus flavus TaxID=1526572 RepID=A0A8J2Y5A4_9PROT|nr:CBS domain-containing protein [Aquisalinus flavus]MBD0426099.1 CBS domain-containing protein [Aquisalinus flavus]UNE48316.1 CBS domain-containing protein [Aquisalinus flavus]GGD10637.1 inosine-5-monophosphate dehydrogenase [Aquisalinus flavus]